MKKPIRPFTGAALCAAAALLAAPLTQAAAGYTPSGTCEGFPRVQVKAPAGYCVGLVADEKQDLKFPRRMLEVAPGRFWVVDMGGWQAGRGRLLEMTLPAGATTASFKTLADKLDRPSSLAIGPDGKAYIGEATRIWRTPTGKFAQETVIDGLPGDGAHPLKEIAFGSGGKLYVNVGSFTDSCRNDAQQQPLPCPEIAGPKPRAAVYEAVLAGADFHVESFKPFATGLRNSMALAVLKKPGQPDVVLQGENSIDYPQVDTPSEEFNILQAGSNHGWPYCVENQQPARGYEGRFDCKTTVAPQTLWPAHAAPLQMLIAPAASPWAGQLVVAWHGYKPSGQRVMAFAVDGAGKITGKGTELLGDWAAKAGVRPQGAPTGLAIDSAGRLFVIEDRNHTILVVGKNK
jgi:glucose/arabinose dehydrogenase